VFEVGLFVAADCAKKTVLGAMHNESSQWILRDIEFPGLVLKSGFVSYFLQKYINKLSLARCKYIEPHHDLTPKRHECLQ
jgi:hypothetical protein